MNINLAPTEEPAEPLLPADCVGEEREKQFQSSVLILLALLAVSKEEKL